MLYVRDETCEISSQACMQYKQVYGHILQIPSDHRPLLLSQCQWPIRMSNGNVECGGGILALNYYFFLGVWTRYIKRMYI